MFLFMAIVLTFANVGEAWSSEAYACKAFCLNVSEAFDSRSGLSFSIVNDEKSTCEGVGDSRDAAFRSMVERCRERGGTHVLSDYKKEAIDAHPYFEKLSWITVLVDSSPATIAKCFPAPAETGIVDPEGRIVGDIP